MLVTDIPFMVAVAVACLPIFFTGYTIARWEGLVFVVYYGLYTAYLLLDAAGDPEPAPVSHLFAVLCDSADRIADLGRQCGRASCAKRSVRPA
jgi:hypothetical protein